MAGFSYMETIERSPDQVFGFMTDLYKTAIWIKGLISVDPITRGPMRVGTKWSEIRRMGDREINSIIEIVEHDAPGEGRNPPYTYAGRSVQMGIQSTWYFRLEPEGEGNTRVEMTTIVRGNNFIANLFVPFYVNAMKKQDSDLLANLKHAIEARPVFTPPLDDEPEIEEAEEVA